MDKHTGGTAMGLAQKKTTDLGSERQARRTRPRAARALDPSHHSPAVALQAHLEMALAEAPTDELRWSPRRALAFMVLVNGAFWIGLGLLISRL